MELPEFTGNPASYLYAVYSYMEYQEGRLLLKDWIPWEDLNWDIQETWYKTLITTRDYLNGEKS